MRRGPRLGYWQDRVLPKKRILTVRAKLAWTLFFLILLTLIPVFSSLHSIHQAQEQLSGIGIDSPTRTDRTVERALSLAERDLIVQAFLVLALACLVVATAPRWILKPIRGLTRLLHQASSGQYGDIDSVPESNDEVGQLAHFLAEHLARDRAVDELRTRAYRRNRMRAETLFHQLGVMAAGVSPGGKVYFLSQKLREALGTAASLAGEPPLAEIWPDNSLIDALAGFRKNQAEDLEIELSGSSLSGRRARLVRTHGSDPDDAEILILIPLGSS